MNTNLAISYVIVNLLVGYEDHPMSCQYPYLAEQFCELQKAYEALASSLSMLRPLTTVIAENLAKRLDDAPKGFEVNPYEIEGYLADVLTKLIDAITDTLQFIGR